MASILKAMNVLPCPHCHCPGELATIERPTPAGLRVIFYGCYNCAEARLGQEPRHDLATHMALVMARHVIVDPVTPRDIDEAVAAIDTALHS